MDAILERALLVILIRQLGFQDFSLVKELMMKAENALIFDISRLV